MAEIINFRKARKVRAKAAEEAEAAANRSKFGRTKADKTRTEAEADLSARKLDAHRREPDGDESA